MPMQLLIVDIQVCSSEPRRASENTRIMIILLNPYSSNRAAFAFAASSALAVAASAFAASAFAAFAFAATAAVHATIAVAAAAHCVLCAV